MSYAGNVSRTRGARSAQGVGPGRPALSTVAGGGAIRPADGEGESEIAWREVAIFGAGIALGLAMGAGSALLLAPESGEETRASLRRRGRRLGRRAHDAWDDLRDELRFATRRGRRRLHRVMDRGYGRWSAEDCD